MTLGLGASHKNLMSQNLMSQIPVSQSIMTMKRLCIGEMRHVFPNMTWAMPQGSPINTLDTLVTSH